MIEKQFTIGHGLLTAVVNYLIDSPTGNIPFRVVSQMINELQHIPEVQEPAALDKAPEK